MRTSTERFMLAGCWTLALANFGFLIAGVVTGTSPALWALNAACGCIVGFMGFVIWDDTR